MLWLSRPEAAKRTILDRAALQWGAVYFLEFSMRTCSCAQESAITKGLLHDISRSPFTGKRNIACRGRNQEKMRGRIVGNGVLSALFRKFGDVFLPVAFGGDVST